MAVDDSLDGVVITETTFSGKDAGVPLMLWYDKPAQAGTEREAWERLAQPLGNGTMGAMVFGRTDTERIQLNHDSLWTGGPSSHAKTGNADAYGNVDVSDPAGTMQGLVDNAFTELYRGLQSGAGIAGTPPTPYLPNSRETQGAFQNFAEVYLELGHKNPTLYKRFLDLRTATAGVEYQSDGVHYASESFISNPDNILIYRIKADQAGSLNLTLRPVIPHCIANADGNSHGQKNYGKTGTVNAAGDSITLSGNLNHNSMAFAGAFRVIATDGVVTASNDSAGLHGMLKVANASSVTIVVALETDYVNDFSADYKTGQSLDGLVQSVLDRIDSAGSKFDVLQRKQRLDYQKLFNRAELSLTDEFPEALPTDRMLAAHRTGEPSPYLEMLYFQFGRYLLISSSREGSLPANLQGVWNDQDYPSWASDFHMNINMQMNYWPAFVTNIAETARPLVDYVDGLREPGRISLAKTYGIKDTGNEDGFLFFNSTAPLGFSGNINSNASFTPTATAFIAQNLFDYYAFTLDKDYLRSHIYPILKESAKTYLKTLQPGRSPDGSDKGKLFVVPSYSSENGPWTVGAYVDQQLVSMLFTNTIEAAKALGADQAEDASLTNLLGAAIAKLDPIQVTASGHIKQWQHEVQYNKTGNGSDIGDPIHRHISELVALYPGSSISGDTPELMAAAKKTLDARGDAATGWSMGHKLSLWARSGDGERAYKLLTNLLNNGTYNNLFDYHPPFQIDGNFGGTAGIAEMLIQSHSRTIHVLPAVPTAWSSGSFNGFKARGNVTVDAAWNKGSVTRIAVTAQQDGKIVITSRMFNSSSYELHDSTGTPVIHTRSDGTAMLQADAGQEYTFQASAGTLPNPH